MESGTPKVESSSSRMYPVLGADPSASSGAASAAASSPATSASSSSSPVSPAAAKVKKTACPIFERFLDVFKFIGRVLISALLLVTVPLEYVVSTLKVLTCPTCVIPAALSIIFKPVTWFNSSCQQYAICKILITDKKPAAAAK